MGPINNMAYTYEQLVQLGAKPAQSTQPTLPPQSGRSYTFEELQALGAKPKDVGGVDSLPVEKKPYISALPEKGFLAQKPFDTSKPLKQSLLEATKTTVSEPFGAPKAVLGLGSDLFKKVTGVRPIDVGREAANVVLSGEIGVGENLGNAIYSTFAGKKINKINKDLIDSGTKQLEMAKAEQNPDRKARLINNAKEAFKIAGGNWEQIVPAIQKTDKQILGDFGQVALDIVSAGTYGATKKVGKIAIPTVLGQFKAGVKPVIAGGALGYGYDVSQKAQQDRDNIFTPGLGTAIGAGVPALGAITKLKPNQTKVINELEQKYTELMSGTTAGKKKIAKLGQKTEALNLAGTEGKTPQRVLAESGIFPNRKGTKLDTFEQAEQFRETIKPLREVNRESLDFVSQGTPPIKLADLEVAALANAKTPQNVNSGRYASMEKEIKNRFANLAQYYPSGDVPLTIVDDIKSAHWDNVFGNKSLVEADRLAKDADYSIAKAAQKTIENTAKQTGHNDVAQLNREIGDRLEAAKYLEDLNGKTIKGGRLLKYATSLVGASLGATAPGKLMGAIAGNAVGELILSYNVSSPISRALLKNLAEKDPEAYIRTVQWLKNQYAEKTGRLALPPAKPKGSKENPIILPMKDTSGGKLYPAKKTLPTRNPKTGRMQTTYSSEAQSKSPIK